MSSSSGDEGEGERVELELGIASLAAGGDGVGRDDRGRVTFVPRTAVGDRVRARVVQAKKSFARAELVEVLEPGPSRVEPPCKYFRQQCGGCQWQHVARDAQLAAKHAIVVAAMRKLPGVVVHPVEDPAPPYGWRRRARFHVVGGRIGLYEHRSRWLVPIASCPQLEPELDAALAVIARHPLPDGELSLLLAHDGKVAVATERPWRDADQVVGHGALVGNELIELEPGLWTAPGDFAQASRLGNAALIARTVAAAGVPLRSGSLLELHAGSGNLSRALVAAGWDVWASDVVKPARPAVKNFLVGAAEEILAREWYSARVANRASSIEVIVLDPPRTGALDAMDGIGKLAPTRVVYVSCDAATLARDLGRLAVYGYRAIEAWPIDLMPQTAHVEIVALASRG